MALGFLHKNKKVSNLIWALRAFWGHSPETLKEEYFKKKTGYMLTDYMHGAGSKRLNIGSQGNNLDGWLNTDVWATPEGVAFLDATKKFPFSAAIFGRMCRFIISTWNWCWTKRWRDATRTTRSIGP